MITELAFTTLWSTDQERTLAFCTEKLGLELRCDVREGNARWITVGVPGVERPEIAVMPTDGPGLDPESAEALSTLVAKGVLGVCAFHTDDCRAEHRRLEQRGVEFVLEPQERPYGTEAMFRDDSGNWCALTQPHVAAKEGKR
ncbi:VOC family protein [Streptomyces sulphureus]|uniref:VOC family protein n=1 Tax=Streptomyces sulphureus TaxID=47758 RepID=UPI000361BD47|nr:VOC family protein [Streptomyces sulphureus]